MYGDIVPAHHRAWEDLALLGSEAFACRLKSWTSSETPGLARAAARYLAFMARPRDLSLVRRLLDRGPWGVRTEIAHGLRWAGEARRLASHDSAKAFEALAQLACGEVPMPPSGAAESAASAAIEALNVLAPSKAASLMRSARAIHRRNPALRAVLLHIDSDRIHDPDGHTSLDSTLLWPVYDAVKSGRLKLALSPDLKKGGVSQVLGLILILAADRDPIATRAACRRVLADRRADESLHRDARAAVRLCLGVPDPEAVLSVFSRSPRRFGTRATKVLSAFTLVDHSLREGLVGYFANSGHHWRAAAGGLAILGCEKPRGILRRAAGAVESFGPLTDRAAVARTTASMTDAADAKVDALGDQLMSYHHSICAAINREMTARPREYSKRG
jgi:hypothetical protein